MFSVANHSPLSCSHRALPPLRLTDIHLSPCVFYTGKESVNAILPVGVVMCRAIRAYHKRTGYRVGFKPAGGIRSAKDSLVWLILMKEELGDAWLNNSMFRIGASSLLGDIERQLFHHAYGRYAAAVELPMA